MGGIGILGRATQFFQARCGHDSVAPSLGQHLDLENVAQRIARMNAGFQLPKHRFSAIQQTRLEEVFAEFIERLHAMLLRKIGTVGNVLVDADGAVQLAASAKQRA